MKKITFTLLFFCSLSFAYSQIDWVGNMGPTGNANTAETGIGYNIYIQVYDGGVTEPAGQGAGISCSLHYGMVSSWGGTWSNTTTVPMTYNTDIGNNDEYVHNLDIPAGMYEYTCYCEDGSGQVWQGGGNAGVTFLAPLPVQLTEFSGVARDGSYLLHWKTSAEKSNLGFEIETAVNPSEFERIGFVNGAGQSAALESYQFTFDAYDRALYFRLKQVEEDGSFSYSKTIFLQQKEAVVDITVSPNPFTDQISVALAKKKDVVLSIIASNGHVVFAQKYTNENRIDLANFERLPNGLYILHIQLDDQRYDYKIIKN